MQHPIYLNTASCGLVTPEITAAANKLYSEFDYNSSTRSEYWKFNEESRIRQTIADFVGALAKNVAMIPNFSWALNGIVQSLKGTERVLLYRNDFPSVLIPFKINNFPITWVDAPDGFNIEIDKIREAIVQKQVDIVALSHVQWGSGYTLDLREIGDLCRQHGVLFIVDGTQALGANIVKLSELNVDVYAASNYKWMNGGFGTGVLYITDEFLKKYPPVIGGFNSTVGRTDNGEPTIRSYEPGSPNMYGLTLLESAIKIKQQMGIENIQAHNRRLAQMFLDGIKGTPVRLLGDHSMNNRCSIILLVDENGLGDWIKQHNIVVTHRNGYLRVSMHYYNTEADVQVLVDCIRMK